MQCLVKKYFASFDERSAYYGRIKDIRPKFD
jgi:hypothetical protein